MPGLDGLSQSARGVVLANATTELAARSRLALASHLAFLTIVVVASDLGSRLGALFGGTAALMAMAGIARARISRCPEVSTRWWRWFALLTITNAWLWGGCALVVTLDQGLGPKSLVFWIMNAGIAAGGTSSLKPNPALARWFVAGLLGPLAVAAAIVSGAGWSVSFMMGIGILLLFALGREVSASYWNGLIKDAQLTARSQELEKARSHAEAALAGREVFFASVSQELRTPLNSILGAVRVLTDARLPDELANVIKSLVETGGNLHYVVNQILDFARVSSGVEGGREDPVDLIELLDDVLEREGVTAASQGLVLASFVDSSLPSLLLADRHKLVQILGNLLSNAVRYSDAGTVSVRAARWPDAGGSWVQFVVEDEGIGLTEDQCKRLFSQELMGDRFGPRSGVGLGLAIARRNVEGCGGQIGCERREGVGTRFWFRVPLVIHEGYAETKPPGDLGVAILAANHAVSAGLTCRLQALGVSHIRHFDRTEGLTLDLLAGCDVLLVDPSADVSMAVVDRLMKAARWQCRLLLLDDGRTNLPRTAPRLRHPVRRSALLQALSGKALGGGSLPLPETDGDELWPLKRGLVLVVSNNNDTALTARALLRQLHLEAIVANDADTALASIRGRHLDAIVLDLAMPGAAGIASQRSFAGERFFAGERGDAPAPRLLGLVPKDAAQESPAISVGVDAVLSMPLSLEALSLHLVARPGLVGDLSLSTGTRAVAAAARPLIIIADDDPVEVHLIKLMLRGLYDVEVFGDGEAAVKRVAEGGVALVLMDIDMQGMGGYEATHAIKQITDRFLPVILIADQENDQRQADSLALGADFSLARPLNPQIVRGKIAAALRIHRLFEETKRQRDELGRVQQRTNEDLAIAERVLRKILSESRFDFSSLRLSLSSVERFNGDLAMVLPVAGRKLRFFLGDFTGHGLGAAVGAMPIGDIFLSVTERRLSIETAVREMNTKLRRILPPGLFLSALAGELDVRTGRLVYWNGGLPDGYVLRADGTIRTRLRSRHLPIGVVGDDAFESRLEVIQIEEGDRIFVCTDGVMETVNAAGALFGEDRVESILTSSSPQRFWSPRLDEALDEHRGGAGLRDDTTYLEIHFDEGLRRDVASQCNGECSNAAQRIETLELNLSPARLRAADPLSELRAFVERQVEGERSIAIANSVVSELVVNAIDHGLLGLQSAIKDRPGGFGEYFAQREQRLATLDEGNVAVQLGIRDSGRERVLKIRVEDTGAGFAMPVSGKTDDVPHGAIKHGRGLELVRAFSRGAAWSDGGRVAEAEVVLENKSEG